MLNRVSMVDPEEVNVTFDDVKGVDEAKQELHDIVEYLRDPQKFKSLGAKLPKGLCPLQSACIDAASSIRNHTRFFCFLRCSSGWTPWHW